MQKFGFSIIILLMSGLMSFSFAQSFKINLNDLTQETQKMSQSADELTLIWWIPEEYWVVSFKQAPNMTETQIEEFVKVLRPYTLIVAVDGKIGAFGGATYVPKATIEQSIQIVDSNGEAFKPLTQDKIDADTTNFLSMMKPVFSNMLGPMGQNMHFFLFPQKSSKGNDIAKATEEGSFTVKLGKREFSWRLPIGSVLPPKTCPDGCEGLSGAWKFCPWHGSALK